MTKGVSFAFANLETIFAENPVPLTTAHALGLVSV